MTRIPHLVNRRYSLQDLIVRPRCRARTFRLLLGRPVQRVLLSSLNEHPDGYVDIIPCDLLPVIHNHIARHNGFVWPLTYEATPTTSYGST